MDHSSVRFVPAGTKTTGWLPKHSKCCSVTRCNLPLVSTRSFNLCVTFVPLRGLASPPQITALPPRSAFEEWGDGRFQTWLRWFLLKLRENRRRKRKLSRCFVTFNPNFPALYCNLLNVEDCTKADYKREIMRFFLCHTWLTYDKFLHYISWAGQPLWLHVVISNVHMLTYL